MRWNYIDIKEFPKDGEYVLAVDDSCDTYCACMYREEGNKWESLETGVDFNQEFNVTKWIYIDVIDERIMDDDGI